jgi:hypothetical protein
MIAGSCRSFLSCCLNADTFAEIAEKLSSLLISDWHSRLQYH